MATPSRGAPGTLAFRAEVFAWRGPAPYHFVAVPDEHTAELEDASSEVSYGWGMVPVRAWTGDSEWTTSLWPKGGRYLLPVKTAVRRAEGIELGDGIDVVLRVEVRR